MSGDPNVATLQTATNRYTSLTGQAPIAVTGAVDDATDQAVLNALSVIVNSVPSESSNATQLIATVDPSQIQQSAAGLTIYLNQNADTLGLSAAPVVVGSTFPMSITNAGASLSNLWKGLPTPVKIGGALLLLLGAGWGIHYAVKKHAEHAEHDELEA